MIDPYIQQLINLLSPAEWKALLMLLAFTIAATHTVKVAWRLSPVRGGGNKQVYLLAAVISFVASYFIWPRGSVPWWAMGTVGGPASNLTFLVGFALLGKFCPVCATALNFDRRIVNNGPPPDVGQDRRKP